MTNFTAARQSVKAATTEELKARRVKLEKAYPSLARGYQEKVSDYRERTQIYLMQMPKEDRAKMVDIIHGR